MAKEIKDIQTIVADIHKKRSEADDAEKKLFDQLKRAKEDEIKLSLTEVLDVFSLKIMERAWHEDRIRVFKMVDLTSITSNEFEAFLNHIPFEIERNVFRIYFKEAQKICKRE